MMPVGWFVVTAPKPKTIGRWLASTVADLLEGEPRPIENDDMVSTLPNTCGRSSVNYTSSCLLAVGRS